MSVLHADPTSVLTNVLKKYSGKELNLMIAGGSLIDQLCKCDVKKWNTERWNVYFADERCEEQHSNYRAAGKFLKLISGKSFPMCGEYNKEEAANEYEKKLANHKPDGSKFIDECILGIGPDGHICSLMPGSDVLNSTKLVSYVKTSATPSPERITITIRFINEQINSLLFIVPLKNDKLQDICEPNAEIKNKIKIQYKIIIEREKEM